MTELEDKIHAAARNAAHEIEPGCLARFRPDRKPGEQPAVGDWRNHSMRCDRATKIIFRHMQTLAGDVLILAAKVQGRQV